MSAFELPLEHLRTLVSAGHRLGISHVATFEGSIVRLDLETFDGRSRLLNDLRSQNRSALGHPTPSHDEFFVNRREEPWPNPCIDLPKDAAQIIQWVRCYEYQSSESPTWNGSIAQSYCSLLTGRLLDRISQMFELSWVLDPQAGSVDNSPLIGIEGRSAQ